MSAAERADVASLREKLWEVGFRPVPVYTVAAGRRRRHSKPGKQPFGSGWTDAARRDPPAAVTDRPHPDSTNTGILCDGLQPIDIDVDNPDQALRCAEIAREMFGEAPTRWRTNSPRRLLLYRAAVGEPPKRSVIGSCGKLEVLGKGQQFVAFGDHESNVGLQWIGDAPGTVLRDSIPAVTEEQIIEYLARCAPIIGARPPSPSRQWLRPLRDTPMTPAPAWLDGAIRTTTAFDPPAIAALASGPGARNNALMRLQRACAQILAAPNGSQNSTMHAQCFRIGRLIGRGDLDYETAYIALLAAARGMPTYRDPWRSLDTHVERSIRVGMDRTHVGGAR